MACVKHFALNSMENMRFSADVECAEDVLHECYLPHFRQTLEEGGCESIMSAYNSCNGEWCGDNKNLLNGVVRDTWGYEDVVITSDWLWGTRDASKSVAAGLDVEMPIQSVRAFHLARALRDGKAEWEHVDRIVKRLLRAQLKLHLRIGGTEKPAEAVAGCEEHRELAKRVAAEGMTLLKNTASRSGDQILPLDSKKTKRILVVGELAVSDQTGDRGSSNLVDPTVVTPLDGLKKQAGVEVIYLDGSNLAQVERACKDKDVDAVFVLVGYTGIEEGEYVSTFDPALLSTVFPFVFPHYLVAKAFTYVLDKALAVYGAVKGGLPGGDRQSLRLKRSDEALVNVVAEHAGSKMVLGIESSGPVVLPRTVRQEAAAILHTGYAGCQFGNALREVLFGQAEPAGRLAYGFVESELDIVDIDMNATKVRYDRFWGYRLGQQRQVRPAYPFGFGLGYGNVQLGNASKLSSLTERFFEVQVTVKNQGKHKSSDVIQVYGGKTSPSSGDYQRVLLGFTRTKYLEQGESESVTVQCRLDPLAGWISSEKSFKVDGGSYDISISKYEGDEKSQTQTVKIEQVDWSVKTQIAQAQ